MFDDLDLNAQQREAVTCGGGPVLVVAGAGSGKTMTLACRVAWLIDQGVAPERILLLTFSRRAAREMVTRAARMNGHGSDAGRRVWGGTFHAMANRLLRLHGRALGLQPDFTVLDQADGADLMNLIRGELGLSARERRFPRKDTLASIYSRTVNARERLPVVLERDFPWCAEEVEGIRSVFQAYTKRKREQNVLDYDDLLLHWRALTDVPRVGDRVASQFDHVLVDEYQDTNALQADILAGMRRPPAPGNLMVVGDDAQAIYSFRSATNRNILEFASRFAGARVVKLEQNYRSTPPLLAASNAAIALSPERHEKTLWSVRQGVERPALVTCLDEAEQSDEVCRSILEHRERGTALKRQAVLFRAAHHSDLLEVELARRNIPFVKYGGLKFLEAAHVKDAMATLRVVENPNDEVSWFRVLQLLEGIGPAAARKVMEALGVRRRSERPENGGIDAGRPSPLARLLEAPPRVPAAAAEGFAAFRSTVADCRSLEAVAPQVERVRRFLEPAFVRLYASPASRLRDLEQLEQIASGYPNRGRFLTDLTLDPPASTGDLAGPPLLDEDYVVLSTIHSAKGCEWDVVHVIHAADGMIPSDMSTGDPEQVEEERRLLYVAITRAKDSLTVYFPLRYYRRPRGLEDPHAYAQLTRFLPPEVRTRFDERCSFLADAEGDGVRADPGSAVGQRTAVDGFLAALWD
jgi:DNA helicase-2/ATP-dependent DNA helicase PcrA